MQHQALSRMFDNRHCAFVLPANMLKRFFTTEGQRGQQSCAAFRVIFLKRMSSEPTTLMTTFNHMDINSSQPSMMKPQRTYD